MRADQIRGAIARDRAAGERTALVELAALVITHLADRDAVTAVARDAHSPERDRLIAAAIASEGELRDAVRPPIDVVRRSARPDAQAEVGAAIERMADHDIAQQLDGDSGWQDQVMGRVAEQSRRDRRWWRRAWRCAPCLTTPHRGVAAPGPALSSEEPS